MVVNVEGEITPVILAAGPGSRIKDMTRSVPKCLLPIGNKPMVIHPLQKLIQAGFKEAVIVVLKNQAQEIETKISQFNLKIELNYLTVNSSQEDHLGTLDSLRRINENMHSDVLIISCDTLGDYNLVPFVNEFRQNSPSLLALTCRGNVASVTRCYGSKNRLEKDIIGLDSNKRIVIFNSESDFEKNVTLTCKELDACPEFTLHNNLLDGHVYLMKKCILDHFLKEESISSLKGELLPNLVQMQFSLNSDKLIPEDLFHQECLKFEPFSGPLRGLLLSRNFHQQESLSNGSVTCYAHLHPGYIIRVNTLMGYIEANKRFVIDSPRNLEKSQDEDEDVKMQSRKFLSDPSSTLGTGTSIVRSVIGYNCKIGSKVKISDSVIMDGVTIEDAVIISNTVICSNVSIGKQCELDMCLVTEGFILAPGSKIFSELVAEGSDVDIEDL